MERKNYDGKMIGIFDTIGSFFVDVFYNNHYLFSRDLVKSGRASSLTDAYKGTVANYMSGIASRKDLYMTVVKSLHEYYQKSSGFGVIIFPEFEDKLLSQFIPNEYYRDFTEKHKDNTLHEIIVKTVNEFGEVILSRDVLKRIIDDHPNLANVSYLQDRIVDIFITQREDYYAKFIREISKNNGNNKVSKELLDKLKQAFVSEKKKRCDIENDRDRAIEMISQLVKKIKELETENTALNQKLKNLYDMRSQNQQYVPVETVYNMQSQPLQQQQSQQQNTIAAELIRDSTKFIGARSQPAPVQLVDDSLDESDDEDDSEEIYRKQREILAARRGSLRSKLPEVSLDEPTPVQPDTDTSSSDIFSLLDEDPGFG